MTSSIPRVREDPFSPPPQYRRLRADEPISPVTLPDGSAGWLVSRHADVRAMLTDPRLSSSSVTPNMTIQPVPAQTLKMSQAPGNFIVSDPPEHTRYRRLLTGQFTVRRMKALAPHIERLVVEHLDAMRVAGPPADLVEALAKPVPTLVICELLGVPYADRDQFRRQTAMMVDLTGTEDELMANAVSFVSYVGGLVAAKRSEPGEDLISGLIRDGDPEHPLTDAELEMIAGMLLVAGVETTANMIALSALLLLQRPQEWAALLADPARLGPAVEELLRYLSVVHYGVVRRATEDLALCGQEVKAGTVVVGSLASANRDPEHFADPDRLDLRRPRNSHIAFGHGIHQCLGQQLARATLGVAFGQLLTQFPTLRLAVPAEKIEMRADNLVYGVNELPVAWEE